MHDRASSDPTGSFFARLFDTSFAYRLTPQVLPALYFLFIVAAASAALIIVAASLISGSLLLAAAALAFGPMVFCLIVFLARVGLEMAVAVSRIERNVAYLARKLGPPDA